MRRWFALSAIGKDRPGIVAELAEMIFEHGCNLEDSSMTVLGGEFAVLLLFSGSGEDLESRLSSACKRIEWEKRLTIFFRPLEGEPRAYGAGEGRERWELVASGIDKAGIVARVTRALAARDVTIREMRTASAPGAESGTPLYTMRIEMDLPRTVTVPEFQKELERIGEELRIDVTLRKARPLDA
jgi:glycine cleavage system transcriptional repressor